MPLRWFDPRRSIKLLDWPRTRSLRNPASLRRLTGNLRAAEPDIIHVLSNTTLWLNAAVPFWRPIPVVTTVHDVERHPGDHETARLPDWGSSLMARQSDHLTVMGEGLSKAAAARFAKAAGTVHMLPHPAITRYAEDASQRGLTRTGDPNELRLLLFGRIFAYKGLSTLLKAEKRISDRVDNLRITIAGRGDNPRDLSRLMGRPEIYSITHGFVPDSDVAKLFVESDIVVLPYEEASQSGVLHVAATFGKPVIVTDVGELRSTVEQAEMGLVVPPADPEALSEAIALLAKRPELLAHLGRRARSFADGTNAPETVGAAALELYRAIASARQPVASAQGSPA